MLFTSLERQNRSNRHDPTNYQQLPGLYFPQKYILSSSIVEQKTLRRNCNTPLPPPSLSTTIFVFHRSSTHSLASNSRTHVRHLSVTVSLTEDRITQSPILAGAYYFILDRRGRWLADDSHDLSWLPKFGSWKARSGHAAGEFTRVCPDRASSLTGPRIVRTAWELEAIAVSLPTHQHRLNWLMATEYSPARQLSAFYPIDLCTYPNINPKWIVDSWQRSPST